MKNRIFYVCFYFKNSYSNGFQNRVFSSAAVNLIDYVSSVLINSSKVIILSPSWTINKWGFFRKEKIKVNEKLSIYYPFTFGILLKPLFFLTKIYSHLWILYYLVFKIKNKETVIVYHSASLAPIIVLAKFFNNFKLILQINEIFQNVEKIGKFKVYFENLVFSIADSYIYSTILLNDIVNLSRKKRFAICGGVYKNEKKISNKYHDGKIHLVYSGLIDKIKLSGAFLSVELAKKLNTNYVVHIIGFGSQSDLEELKTMILIANDSNCAQVVFDGLKTGTDFNNYLQKCHIGLALQNSDRLFNVTSFPSKIFTYLSNGLQVVSIKNNSISSSPVSNYLYYGKGNDSDSIAQCILKINIEEFDCNILNELDIHFQHEIGGLLN